jgi:hypothetical protein
MLLFTSLSFDAQLVEGGYGCRLFGFLLGLACSGGSQFTGDAHFDAESFLVVRTGFFDDAVITRRHAPCLEQFLKRRLVVGPPQIAGSGGECDLHE